jgi:hypothetical protein
VKSIWLEIAMPLFLMSGLAPSSQLHRCGGDVLNIRLKAYQNFSTST